MNNTAQIRRHRTASEWQDIVRMAEQSDLSVKKFCEQQNINPSGFYAWRKRLQKKAETRGFTPVVLTTEVTPDARKPLRDSHAATRDSTAVSRGHAPPIEIVLLNGRVVRVHGALHNAATLQAVLHLAEGGATC